MASDEPGPGQQYAIQVRKHIAALRRAKPDITIEIRWCPAHKGIAGNEKADEWAKAAAEQSGNHRPIIRSLGYHPKLWKTAKGVVIPKPGKPDYSKVRAYRVISLLDVISKLVERTAAHLIADHLERKRGLHDGQYGCRKRRSCVDAVAVLINRTQQAWQEKRVAGALFMDVKSAFNNVSKAHLGKRMEALGVEPDLIRWAGSFMSDRQVKLVLDGKVGEAKPVDTGIP